MGGTEDPRVAAVLEVLSGRAATDVARERGLEDELLERWVAAFVEAGSARVSNRPDDSGALERDRFLAAFAHELRTPLTVVSGWVDLLDADGQGVGRARAVQQLRRGLDRLTDRLHDLELLGTAAMGRLELDRRPVAVADLVEGLDVGQVAGEGPDVVLHVDPLHFARVVRDLWEASAAQPAPPQRSLSVTRTGPWVQLTVTRVGSPLSHDRLQAMFDPFDHDMDATGVAVGLYLARALTVAHEGTLGVSQDERRTVFWVRVPSAPPMSTGATP